MRSATIIIFFNKVDLFETMLRQIRIKDVREFSDYKGLDNNVNDGIRYFLSKFLGVLSMAMARRGKIHHYVTNATDCESVTKVITQCRLVIEEKIESEQMVSTANMQLDLQSSVYSPRIDEHEESQMIALVSEAKRNSVDSLGPSYSSIVNYKELSAGEPILARRSSCEYYSDDDQHAMRNPGTRAEQKNDSGKLGRERIERSEK
jgi:G-protein alpha subunit